MSSLWVQGIAAYNVIWSTVGPALPCPQVYYTCMNRQLTSVTD